VTGASFIFGAALVGVGILAAGLLLARDRYAPGLLAPSRRRNVRAGFLLAAVWGALFIIAVAVAVVRGLS
jgi:hypothetical protein